MAGAVRTAKSRQTALVRAYPHDGYARLDVHCPRDRQKLARDYDQRVERVS